MRLNFLSIDSIETFESFRELLATPDLAELGPGPRSGVRPETELNRELESRFRETTLSEERRQLIRALILLWHDHLEVAHGIAQGIDNADGAFVHGIMHRREPDYGNAAYWFRRVSNHPTFPELARRVGELLESGHQSALKAELLPSQEWNPFGFVNACQRATGGSNDGSQGPVLRAIQKLETEVLLERFTKLSEL